ncbi:MAG: M4 family metallopeptidase [Flavobacteriaceae bacterium]|nr:M4 family metallopeptidase [Flavobacteriaceae bacterium]
MKIKLTLALMAMLCLFGYSQNQRVISKIKSEPHLQPKLVAVNSEQPIRVRNPETTIYELFDRQSGEAAKLITQENDDQLGQVHYKLQQYYLERILIGNHYTLHTKNNQLISASGIWLKDFSRLTVNPGLSEQDALDIILRGIGEANYAWNNAEWEQEIKETTGNPLASYYPKGRLVYMPKLEEDKTEYALAYEFTVTLTQPFAVAKYYINSVNGELVLKEKVVNNCTTPSTGASVYSGTVNFSSDNMGGSTYRLLSCSNTNSVNIHTRNLNGGYGTGTATEITQLSTNFTTFPNTNDASGIDVHWGMEESYDFTWNNFGRDSYDDLGATINSYVRFGSGAQANNAFYHPNSGNPYFAFGDGDNTTGPWVTADIVGHEWWHAITDHTAGLIYSNESGALNEAYSDIFGELIEAQATNGSILSSSIDWLMGDQLLIGAIRSMSNPHDYNHAKCYEGVYYIDNCPITFGGFSPYDYCGVHSNSGVGNYWFYLLSEGGSGVNDAGQSFTVTGQTPTVAMHIAYRALTVYMTPTTDFAEARLWTLQAAADLYGACSPEYQATANAWHAVCVGTAYQADLAPINLEVDATNCTANLTWLDMVAQDYEYCYREVGTTTWICANGLPSVSLTGLTPGTSYEWRVRSICGASSSPWSVIDTFTTLGVCPSIDTTTGLVENITVCSADILWDSTGALSYNIRYRECGGTTWTVVTSSTNTVTLSGLLDGTCYEVEVQSNCDCDTSEWKPIENFSTTTCPDATMSAVASACRVTITVDQLGAGITGFLTMSAVGSPSSSSTPLGELNLSRTKTFAASPGTTYEYWVTTTCHGDGCSIQTVSPIQTITTPNLAPTCEPPTNFTIEVESLSGNAFVYWFAYWDPSTNATQYEVEFRYNPTDPWISAGTLWHPEYHGGTTGAGSCYLEFRVRAICDCAGENEVSAWVTHVYDEDDFTCIDLEDYNTEQFCDGVIRLYSNPRYCSNFYEWEYREISPSLGPWTTVTSTTNTTDILESSLTPGATYEWRVRLHCSDGTVHPWGPSQFFSTRADCLAPSVLTATQQSGNTMLLDWTVSGSSSTFYLVRWREVGTSIWNGPNTTTSNSYLVTGLVPNVNYEWEVMAVCQDWSFCPADETAWVEGTFIIEDENPCEEAIPQGLTCKLENGQLYLTWGAQPLAVGYEVEIIYNDPDCCPNATNMYSVIIPINTTQTFLQFNPVEPCFSWRVRTLCDGDNISELSEKKCSKDCPSLCLETVPQNLDCQSNGSQTILSWDLVLGATGYHVEINYKDPRCCSNSNNPYGVIHVINTNTPSFTFTPDHKCFSWRVRAICGEEFGKWSEKKCSDCPINKDCNLVKPSNPICEVQNNGFLLSWDTVVGAQGYHIEVIYGDERCCPNASSSYGVIHVVNGNTPHFFLNPDSKYKCFSWRVRAVCEDGFSKWSKYRCSVDCEGKFAADKPANEEMKVSLFPNPGDEWLNINIELPEVSDIEITIHNIVTGRELYTAKVSPMKKASTHQINVSYLPSGVYLVTAKSKEQVVTERFIKK